MKEFLQLIFVVSASSPGEVVLNSCFTFRKAFGFLLSVCGSKAARGLFLVKRAKGLKSAVKSSVGTSVFVPAPSIEAGP